MPQWQQSLREQFGDAVDHLEELHLFELVAVIQHPGNTQVLLDDLDVGRGFEIGQFDFLHRQSVPRPRIRGQPLGTGWRR